MRLITFEILENRSLLTIVAITANVPDVVQVGERFYVEILAREYDPLVGGLRGVALDIAWDPSVLQEIDAEPVSTLVTAHFPVARSGTLDNQAGTIDNLAGSASLADNFGQAIGSNKDERFALLHFQAIHTGQSQFTMRQGLSSIVTVPLLGLEDVDIYFEQPTIRVGSAFVGPLTAEEYFGVDAVFAELLDDNNKDECKWLGRTS